MFYNPSMDTASKLQQIALKMHLEPGAEVGSGVSKTPAVAPCGISLHQSKKHESLGIYNAKVNAGRPVKLLKTMLTTACERNCTYCPFRAGRNYRRITFKPEEMAQSFVDLNRAGMADGIFLSSGIIRGGMRTAGQVARHD